MKKKVLKYLPLFFLFIALCLLYVFISKKTEGLKDKDGTCAQGSWCTNGNKYPCSGGNYGSSTNSASPQCDGACDAGCYCLKGSVKSCPTFCPKGYYCPKGTETPIVCPKGYYCLERTADPVPCPKERHCEAGTAAI
jgi:hypothetical protein